MLVSFAILSWGPNCFNSDDHRTRSMIGPTGREAFDAAVNPGCAEQHSCGHAYAD
jgi:hypothetical protein